ncbi:MFS transporter [Brevibacterium album]|uniref:MFS transporter n=1 Tax=Brevibacterium album TaxID=417948 RepID=UPI00041AEF19|nr:MFS transporter [Brevibacterium album]
MPEQKLWTRTFVIGIVVNLFMAVVFYLLMTTMAMYAVDRFRASETGSGLASSAFIIGAVAGRVLAGKFLDFIGRRRLLIISMAVFAVAGIAYVPVGDFALLIVLRLVHGAAFGMGNTALVASIQSVIPGHRRAEGNGYFGTATTLATALGPFLGVWLSGRYGFEVLFWLSSLSGLAAMLAALLYTVEEREPGPEERARKWSLHPSTFVDAPSLRVGAVMCVAGAAYSAVLSFLAVHTAEIGLPGASGTFFLVFAVGSLAARLFAGRVQDRFGDNIVLVPVFISYGAGMIVVAEAHTVWMFGLAGLLVGLGFGCLLPSLQAILISRTPAARVGVATSTFYLMLDFGTGVGPVFLGPVAAAGGYSAMYWLCGGLVVVAAVVYALVHGRRARGGRQGR